MNVLIVEDDDGMAEALQQMLGMHGYATQHTRTGSAALDQLPAADLVLLDLVLPDLAGHEVCRRIREQSCVPIIVLSGSHHELDQVLALNSGADDFVPKPFGRYELLARIGAVLRRGAGCLRHGGGPAADAVPPPVVPAQRRPLTPQSAPRPQLTVRPEPAAAPPPRAAAAPAPAKGPDPETQQRRPETQQRHLETQQRHLEAEQRHLRAGPLRLDARTRKVHLHDGEVRVTRKEFDLLAMLLEEPGTVLRREEIMAQVWDENWFGSTRTLDVHVGSLRGKLGSPQWIETVRGVGYRLTVPAATAALCPAAHG
ncbi:response regulator transcription factor [Streptomyces sp. NPDC029674]|uniref:response regulator transcription factor n=1 Tax=Streptomyces sp. NPDC029674 TaxID=3365297 RepID=UPI00384D44B2